MIYPACAVAIRVRFTPLEKGDHHIDIGFLDADGNEVIPTLHGSVAVDVPPSETSVVVNLVLNLQGVKFAQMGEYAVALEIDGEEKSVIPLFLKYA